MGTKYLNGISVKQHCLFTVFKEIKLKDANKLADEEAKKRGIEHNTLWYMSTRVFKKGQDYRHGNALVYYDVKALGDLWISILSHFNTGRDKHYWLYVITWE